MSVVLVATPMSASANTYATLAEFDQWLGDRPNVTDVLALSDDEKGQLLIQATSWLDALFNWGGYIRSTTQRLRFPRYGLSNPDGILLSEDVIPRFLMEATCEFAIALQAKDRIGEPELIGQGIQSATVGDLSVTVAPGGLAPFVPQQVMAMVSYYGELIPAAARGSRIAKLLRA